MISVLAIHVCSASQEALLFHSLIIVLLRWFRPFSFQELQLQVAIEYRCVQDSGHQVGIHEVLTAERKTRKVDGPDQMRNAQISPKYIVVE